MLRSQIVTLSTKGQLVLPRSIRSAVGLRPGSRLTVTLEDDGTISARPVRRSMKELLHSLKALQAPETLDVDASISQAVQEADDATHRH